MGILSFFRKYTGKRITEKPDAKVTVSFHDYTPEELREQQCADIQEKRELQEKAALSKNGLQPQEILLLSYAPKYYTDQTDFPSFWHYKYAISNPSDVLKKLEKKGLVRQSTAAESLDNLTMQELKNVLSGQGLKVSGKKAELIERVKIEVPESVIEKSAMKKRYALTELGQAEINDNEYVVSMHKNDYGVSVLTINNIIGKNPTIAWKDSIWGELNRELLDTMKYLKDGNASPMVSVMYRQVAFLKDEGRTAEAIETLIDALHKEISIIVPQKFKIDEELFRKGIITTKEPSFVRSVEDRCSFGFSLLNGMLQSANNGGSCVDILERCRRIRFDGAIIAKDEYINLLSARISDDCELFCNICDNVQKRLS